MFDAAQCIFDKSAGTRPHPGDVPNSRLGDGLLLCGAEASILTLAVQQESHFGRRYLKRAVYGVSWAFKYSQGMSICHVSVTPAWSGGEILPSVHSPEFMWSHSLHLSLLHAA